MADRLELHLGDLRDPPVSERVPLVICPFRSLLHMETEDEKLGALVAARSLLQPDGRYVFDVFAPSREDIDETHDRWLEREPGIFERAVWDEGSRTLSLSVRSGDASATFGLHWLSAPEWLRLLDQRGLRDRGALRLVRLASVRGRRGHDLRLPAASRLIGVRAARWSRRARSRRPRRRAPTFRACRRSPRADPPEARPSGGRDRTPS